MPPALASGEILRKGTAEVTTLMLLVWANELVAPDTATKTMKLLIILCIPGKVTCFGIKE
jgi:hypothetical protein